MLVKLDIFQKIYRAAMVKKRGGAVEVHQCSTLRQALLASNLVVVPASSKIPQEHLHVPCASAVLDSRTIGLTPPLHILEDQLMNFTSGQPG